MPEMPEEKKAPLVKPLRPEAMENQEPKVGVYVCSCGGNIGDTVRCERVVNAMQDLPNVAVARHFMFMCSDPGQKLIAEDIAEQGVNRVVVGACSPFLHEQTFRRTVERAGLNPYLYTHVGLREQDSWVHHERPAQATEKAIRLMSAGVAKARRMRPLDPIRLKAEKQALVIGGGVSGLRAALSIARSGLKVTLIEKQHYLGGRMTHWEQVFPTGEGARELIHKLIGEALAEPNITLHTGAEVIAAAGYVGNFEIKIRQIRRGVAENFHNAKAAIEACPVEVKDEFNFGISRRKAIYQPYAGCFPAGAVIDWQHCTRCGECLKHAASGEIDLSGEPLEFELRVGAVVVATGFRPYEPFQGEFGYGEYPEVITLPQLERILSGDGPTGGKLEWNGHPVRSIAMVHCVGSRQLEGVHAPQPDGKVNDYCSRVCCTATLSAAIQIRARFPQVHIYDLYQDIRTYGRGHEDYYTQASKGGVTFLRTFAEEQPEVIRAKKSSAYPILLRVKDHLTFGEEIDLPVDLVVLSVGMMPNPVEELVDLLKISPGSDRFLLEVHPKLRPVETAVTGVVLAGTAQGPMNIQESCAAAEAAASKVAILLGSGEVELEPYVAQVDPARCQGSGECVRICPQENAVHLESFAKNGTSYQQAVVVPANCNGCGVCVSACPNHAIDVQGWRLDEFEAMVAAIAGTPVDANGLETLRSDAPALEGAQ